ncbi:LptM family lipoprotein, partial [Klebsiella michiganensis]
MKKIIRWVAAATIIGALAGCARTAPIEQIHTTVSAGHTEAEVKNAIIKAGAQREWIMSDAGPGVINARQQIRDHIAEIKINYSATSYSINYATSSNLMASGGKIHRNYNR